MAPVSPQNAAPTSPTSGNADGDSSSISNDSPVNRRDSSTPLNDARSPDEPLTSPTVPASDRTHAKTVSLFPVVSMFSSATTIKVEPFVHGEAVLPPPYAASTTVIVPQTLTGSSLIGQGNDRHTCAECSAVFSTSLQLSKHELVHSNELQVCYVILPTTIDYSL